MSSLTEKNVTLLDILDHILDKGVVIKGEVIISIADVDLIYLGLQLVLASVDKVMPVIQDD
ncbi:Gas vesicle protein [Desulfotomaculum arcticum]|uniref:Gas vesicle protein n=1 Tax=Desulfotruncus arcticus DSM 17038 TaxID=1121424 RepID=A0A1I2VJM2_9FIRM|nr:gas vesicle protein [Desulfotruncus arcticus]SFG88629.1 Gas vesicle protein [Desulfotomaculum arcticum] [Desulfotruncus arcticus DSM 17038]